MSAINVSGWKEALQKVLPKALEHNEYFLAGSTAINGSGNDYDVVITVSGEDDEALDVIASDLADDDWEVDSAEVYRGVDSDGWFSARKGDVNLLVCEPTQAELWRISTDVCIAYRILAGRDTTRDERVFLHKVVWCEILVGEQND